MLGNTIIIEAHPKGKKTTGVISGTPKPGTVMEFTTAVEIGNRKTWQVYQPGTNGQRRVIAVLLDDSDQGKLPTDAYVSGTLGSMYFPIAGEELNMLISSSVVGSGTGTVSELIGQTFIVQSGTGKLINSTGSPQSEPFRLMEEIDFPFSTDEIDVLARCMYTGY